MANLGICSRCNKCSKINRAPLEEDGTKRASSQAVCALASELLEWDSEVPDDCPFRLEHLMTTDAVADLVEEVAIRKEVR